MNLVARVVRDGRSLCGMSAHTPLKTTTSSKTPVAVSTASRTLSTKCTLCGNGKYIPGICHWVYLHEVCSTCTVGRSAVKPRWPGRLPTIHQESCHQIVAQAQSVIIYLPSRLKPGEEENEAVVCDVQHTDCHCHCTVDQCCIWLREVGANLRLCGWFRGSTLLTGRTKPRTRYLQPWGQYSASYNTVGLARQPASTESMSTTNGDLA